MDYRVGQFVCTTDSLTPLGRIIKLGENQLAHVFSPYIASHCANVARWRNEYLDILDNNDLRYDICNNAPDLHDGDLCFIEATWPRCTWRKIEYYPQECRAGRHVVCVCQPQSLRVEDEEKISELLWGFVGKPYQWRVFLQMFGAPNQDRDDKAEYCSEVTAHMLAIEGAGAPLEWLRYGVTPLETQAHAEAAGWVKWRCGYDPQKLFGGTNG
jgi:hypothetical protein